MKALHVLEISGKLSAFHHLCEDLPRDLRIDHGTMGIRLVHIPTVSHVEQLVGTSLWVELVVEELRTELELGNKIPIEPIPFALLREHT